LRVKYTPDVSGSYTVLVSTPTLISQVTGSPADDAAYYTPSSAHLAASFAATTGSSPTTLALSNISEIQEHLLLQQFQVLLSR